MSMFGSLEGMAARAIENGNEQSKVAGGFLQAVEQHPGGIGALLEGFRKNGLGEDLDHWTHGQTQPTTPDKVGTALAGTGVIEGTAQRAGVSVEVAQTALAVILPMAMAHFAPGGEPVQPSQFNGLNGELLSRLL